MQPHHFIDRGTGLSGTLETSMPSAPGLKNIPPEHPWQRSSLCPDEALDLASARSGLKRLISDQCMMSLAKSLYSLISSLKRSRAQGLPLAGLSLHHVKWHIREAFMASEGTRQMLVLRVTMWTIRLCLKVMLTVTRKSQLLQQACLSCVCNDSACLNCTKQN